jgi:endonuclease YncB( thermonuclease family)
MASSGKLTRGLRVFALIAAAMLAGCGQGGLERLARGETGKVVSVHSGDSFTLDSGLEVRLAGVETPRGDQPFADQARTALTLLVVGRRVQLLYGGARRDRYGRALAQVKLLDKGEWLEGEMLRKGQARARTWADNRAMARPMLEDEAYARNRSLGLWALKDYRVLTPPETVGQTGFQIVEGRVLDTGAASDGSAIALQFQRGSGQRFSAEIDAKALADFRTAGADPDKLVGKLLRVRGPIRFGPEGPVMKLDHPEQVELLKER